MPLLVIPDIALRQIQNEIVNATHMATDSAGEKLTLSTIDSRTLASAARIAIEIATGMVVWPGNERLVLQRPRQTAGMFEFKE